MNEPTSEKPYFYADAQNNPAGPHSFTELAALEQQGEISEVTLIAADGWPEWKTWREVKAEESGVSAPRVEPAVPAPEAQPRGAPLAPLAAATSAPSESPQPGFSQPEGASASLGAAQALTHYPWQVDPAWAAKVEAYNAAGSFKSYLCKCNEFLNNVLKHETFKGLKGGEAEIRVYPDVVGIDLREEKPGCLVNLVMGLPESVRPIPIFLARVITFCLQMPSVILGLIFLAVFAVVAVLLLVFFWYIIIPAVILGAIVLGVLQKLAQRHLDAIARRILEKPKSSYAVRKLFKYCATVPRYWHRGDPVGEVVQILRVETRRRWLQRSLIIIVQDNPKESRGGCLNLGMGIYLGRLLRAERRIFVLSIDGGASAADAAAAAMSGVLEVPVTRGEFRFNHLVLT